LAAEVAKAAEEAAEAAKAAEARLAAEVAKAAELAAAVAKAAEAAKAAEEARAEVARAKAQEVEEQRRRERRPSFKKRKAVCKAQEQEARQKAQEEARREITTTVTFEGLDFEKVQEDGAMVAKLKQNVKQTFLQELPAGYTEEHLSVTLSKGSVKAKVYIIPMVGSDTSSLKAAVTANKDAVAQTMLQKVKYMLEGKDGTMFETGKTIHDLTAAATEPVEVPNAPESPKHTKEQEALGNDDSPVVVGYSGVGIEGSPESEGEYLVRFADGSYDHLALASLSPSKATEILNSFSEQLLETKKTYETNMAVLRSSSQGYLVSGGDSIEQLNLLNEAMVNQIDDIAQKEALIQQIMKDQSAALLDQINEITMRETRLRETLVVRLREARQEWAHSPGSQQMTSQLQQSAVIVEDVLRFSNSGPSF